MQHANDEVHTEAEAWLIAVYKEAERRAREAYLAELRRMEKAERKLLKTAGNDLQGRRRYQERADALLGAQNMLRALPPTLPED